MTTDVTRETLDGTPVRVLTFLRAIGTSLSIRRLMNARGYTDADHKEGWTLLHKVSGLTGADSPDDTDTSVRDAMSTLDNSDEDLYRIVRASLTRLHPAQAAFVLKDLAPATGPDSILSVKNLLDRLDVLEQGRTPASIKEDNAALATLATRGFTPEERARFRKLVQVAQSAANVPPVDPAAEAASEEKLVADLIALRAWFEDWSETARAAIKRRDYLIRLGLASRKSSKKKDAPES